MSKVPIPKWQLHPVSLNKQKQHSKIMILNKSKPQLTPGTPNKQNANWNLKLVRVILMFLSLICCSCWKITLKPKTPTQRI